MPGFREYLDREAQRLEDEVYNRSRFAFDTLAPLVETPLLMASQAASGLMQVPTNIAGAAGYLSPDTVKLVNRAIDDTVVYEPRAQATQERLHELGGGFAKLVQSSPTAMRTLEAGARLAEENPRTAMGLNAGLSLLDVTPSGALNTALAGAAGKAMFFGVRAANVKPEALALAKELAAAGEARNVQGRLMRSESDIADVPPWQTLDVPEDEQIVRPALNRPVQWQMDIAQPSSSTTKPFTGAPSTGAAAAEAPRSFDPRYDPRVLEQGRLSGLQRVVEGAPVIAPPPISLVDYEGHPFVTSMSDRTAGGGVLAGVNDVRYPDPVKLEAGQDYPFLTPGQAWASASAPAAGIHNMGQRLAAATGREPLLVPWRMTPSASDYATMTVDTMFQHALGGMSGRGLDRVNKAIRTVVPKFDIRNPAHRAAVSGDPKIRAQVVQILDRDFRNDGGLGIGETRLAIADPAQVAAPDYGLQTVATLAPDRPLISTSGHKTYSTGVPGSGLGRLDRPGSVFDLLPPDYLRRYGIDPANPDPNSTVILRRQPAGGVITEEALRRLGY